MALIARASGTVRNKNLIILIMCIGVMLWFGYDGWTGYAKGNDARVKLMSDSAQVDSGDQKFVRDWKGWVNESPENRQRMDGVAENAKRNVQGMNGWKTVAEINLQRWIVMGLGAASVAAIWWFIHCQRRRVIADETTLSPAARVVIPWEKITRVDNTRWDKMGIVDITYTNAAGVAMKAKLDDYETERKPLLEILDMLSDRAVNAEFFSKDEPAADAATAK